MNDEQKEKVIQGLVGLMRTTALSVEYRVKKKPQGVKVIIEMTQDQMNDIVKQMKNKHKEEKL